MEEEKKLWVKLVIGLGICFLTSYLITYICQDNITDYFDAVYEDERNLVYQILEGNTNFDEFPGASVYIGSRLIEVHYTHQEKGDFLFGLPILLQMNEQDIEIPEYFTTRKAYITDRTSRTRVLLTFKITFVLMAILVLLLLIVRIIMRQYNE